VMLQCLSGLNLSLKLRVHKKHKKKGNANCVLLAALGEKKIESERKSDRHGVSVSVILSFASCKDQAEEEDRTVRAEWQMPPLSTILRREGGRFRGGEGGEKRIDRGRRQRGSTLWKSNFMCTSEGGEGGGGGGPPFRLPSPQREDVRRAGAGTKAYPELISNKKGSGEIMVYVKNRPLY